ncbi:MAG: metalloregulator ArsR/SmtB family transcription factor [Pseudomonadota bacterium]
MCNYASMDETQTQQLADFLKALGEFNRLSLVYELCRCREPQNAMCLCDCCSVDASVVSRHLKVLAEQGIVAFDRKGREKTYRLNRAEVAKQLRSLAEAVESID